ncbi:Uu.00g071360.m01.CDS01 [Anthostomella pinea]|uniref:Uu.00g071360.m01.CDS01 n=1 Tax=Anthostomella pinea TaxID=933095 RepID=A0AAI8YNV7_9PEZI|nr:Uu.00g071360.m01.CDS01 [Anthostomella pinea]
MAQGCLTRHDFNVLEKIKDPESNPLAAVIVDSTLPKDPNVTDAAVYKRVAQKERETVMAMQQLEMQLAGLKPATGADPIQEYRQCVLELGQLVSEYPRYASVRNNRAQALRRLYGDTMMLSGHRDSRALIQAADDAEKSKAAVTTLSDLDEAIMLLTPRALFASISPQAGKTLSLAHTQRATVYHMTAKSIQFDSTAGVAGRKEATWTKIDFEEAASRDFALGGRYGNEIARGLAVSTNPTAKLCGQMVHEAMKKEYGPAFAA